MSVKSDLKVLYHLAIKRVRGNDHAARMEDFYAGQADAYDTFRKRLLQGREALWKELGTVEEGVWVDMGGGTGANIEFFADADRRQLRKIHVVDLAHSLLQVVQQRAAARGWSNVEAHHADATTFEPSEQLVDVVTFSYSLTMIPDWFAAIDHAWDLLRPGGRIGVVDFYVSRKYAAERHQQHGWITRNFWPLWFANDNVFPSSEHLAYLERKFEIEHLHEARAKVPYLPLGRVPYYVFVGRKPAHAQER